MSLYNRQARVAEAVDEKLFESVMKLKSLQEQREEIEHQIRAQHEECMSLKRDHARLFDVAMAALRIDKPKTIKNNS